MDGNIHQYKRKRYNKHNRYKFKHNRYKFKQKNSDLYIEVLLRQVEQGKLTMKQAKADIQEAFFAGVESPGAGLEQSILEMAK